MRCEENESVSVFGGDGLAGNPSLEGTYLEVSHETATSSSRHDEKYDRMME